MYPLKFFALETREEKRLSKKQVLSKKSVFDFLSLADATKETLMTNFKYMYQRMKKELVNNYFNLSVEERCYRVPPWGQNLWDKKLLTNW